MAPELPSQTTVLIVGAGPVGLALALALLEQGVKDFLIVDKLEEARNTSRAFAVHAATMEALDIVGVAEPLVARSTPSHAMHLVSQSGAPLFNAEFHDALKDKSRFPYMYVVPQYVTEEELTKKLREKWGIEVFRGSAYEVRGMRGTGANDDHGATVEFEGGQSVKAKYVIGADGSKSVIRHVAGLSFDDPRASSADHAHPSSAQMLVTDVYFSSPPNLLPYPDQDNMVMVLSTAGFMLIDPFPESPVTTESSSKGQLFRLATVIPPEMGVPPNHPDLQFCQTVWEKFGPDAAKGKNKNKPRITIDEVVWSSRFRTHSAVVDRYFTRFPSTGTAGAKGGAVVFLIGDAAHVHPPAGGQGMNLGIRDAVYLAPVIASHLRKSAASADGFGGGDDKELEAYAAERRSRALVVIGLANGLLDRVMITGQKVANMLPRGSYLGWAAEAVQGTVVEWGLWTMGRIGWVTRFAGRRLSGLNHR